MFDVRAKDSLEFFTKRLIVGWLDSRATTCSMQVMSHHRIECDGGGGRTSLQGIPLCGVNYAPHWSIVIGNRVVEQSNMSTITTQATDKSEVKRIDDFGSGRYSTFMGQVFEGCKSLLNLSPAVSAKIARDAGSDIGSAMKHANDAKISLGKVSKSGTITVKDAANVKGVFVTNPIMIARAIQWIGEAGQNGVSYGNTSWVLVPTLQAYVSDLQTELDTVSVPA